MLSSLGDGGCTIGDGDGDGGDTIGDGDSMSSCHHQVMVVVPQGMGMDGGDTIGDGDGAINAGGFTGAGG